MTQHRILGVADVVIGLSLIGLIWQVRENLSPDVAFRHGLTNRRSVDEIRAGLTFGFPLRFLEGHAAAH